MLEDIARSLTRLRIASLKSQVISNSHQPHIARRRRSNRVTAVQCRLPSMPYGTAKESEPESRAWLMGKEAFETKMPHHEGIKALWETKWRFPCTKSVYPFHDGQYEDFVDVFEHLIRYNINDGTSRAYTEAFFPNAARLIARGDKAAAAGDPKQPSQISAAPSMEEVEIPHMHKQGRDRANIPVYVRLPKLTSSQRQPCPVVLLMTGLDGYRPDNTLRCDELLSRGWGSVVVEIPGTADCPADSADPDSPDRLWSSVLDWMAADGRFDMGRVMVWGLSSGGYYAVRIAHTHKERLIGSIAQGAGCHYFFDEEWLDKADGHEYPFQLTPAMAMKHGYETVAEYKTGVQKKFSLLDAGVIQQPSTRLLLINGTQDGLMPIEDSIMLFEYGTPKEARFFPGALHMGYPMANGSVYPWMEKVMASKA
ncbi:Heptaketide hydrolyase ayg1 like protein [Verticillium longisporum]|nr:Heptaketide hydrolyase ayg1 like protein [Verticillium longisporum]